MHTLIHSVRTGFRKNPPTEVRTSKVTIVTGATGGLGSAVAAALPSAVIKINIRATEDIVALDCTDETCVRRFFADLQDKGQQVQGLVNVAGKPGERALADLDMEFWQDVLHSNVASAMLMTRFAAPLMDQGSAVVNFTSVAAFRGFAERAAYCAAKAAIVGLTKALAVELAPRGIRVNAVALGSIDSPWITRLIEEAQDPQQARHTHEQRALLNRLGKPEEVGALVRFLLAEDASFSTGAVYPVDGGILAY